jgi:hypothetical protein
MIFILQIKKYVTFTWPLAKPPGRNTLIYKLSFLPHSTNNFSQYEQPGDFGGSSTSCFLCHQKAVGGGGNGDGVPQREEEALNATSPAAATLSRTISSCSTTNSASQGMIGFIPWPMPAVIDLTRDGRLSTYDESVLKLSKVSFRGKCARMGHSLKLTSAIKLARRLGHFPPASQAGHLAGPV